LHQMAEQDVGHDLRAHQDRLYLIALESIERPVGVSD
jgi:hypothetical protein